MKKSIRFLLVVIIMVVVIAGCGSETMTPNPPSPSEPRMSQRPLPPKPTSMDLAVTSALMDYLTNIFGKPEPVPFFKAIKRLEVYVDGEVLVYTTFEPDNHRSDPLSVCGAIRNSNIVSNIKHITVFDNTGQVYFPPSTISQATGKREPDGQHFNERCNGLGFR